MPEGTTTVGRVSFDLTISTAALGQAINAASRQISAQLTNSFRTALSGCEQSLTQIGQSVNSLANSIQSDMSSTTNRIQSNIIQVSQDVSQVTQRTTQSISGEIHSLDAEIQSILNRNDLSQRAQVARIAALYRRQGLDMSESMRRAWESVDHTTQRSTDSMIHNSERVAQAVGEPLLSALKKLGTEIGIAFGIRQIVRFTKSCVEGAAQVKALNAQLEQTFGYLEGDARAAIASVAKESGILETRLQSTGTQIYAFAKSAGMDSKTALTMMQEALQVTADSAAFYDRSIEQTAESLRSFLKGNYANDAALGISCTQTTRNIAANKLYGKSFKELSEAQKQLTLLQMVKDANELSGAMGQAAREADGWENVTGNLKEAWKQFKAAIGAPLLQALVPVIQSITTAIQRLTEAVKATVAAFSELFGWEQATGNAVSDIADRVEDAENEAQDEIEETAEKKKKATKSLAGFDDLNILKQPDEDTDDSGAKADVISEKVQNAKRELAGLKEEVDSLNFDGIKEKIQGVIEFVKPMIDSVKSFFKGIADSVFEWWEEKGSPAFDKLRDAFTGVKRVVSDLWQNYIAPFFSYVGKSLGKFWDEHLAPLWTGLLDFISSLMEAIAAIWTGFLEPLYNTFVKRIMVGVLGALKSLWDMVIDVCGIIADVVRGVIRSAQGLLDFITGIFTGDMEKAVKGIAEFVEGIVIVIWGAIKGTLNIIIDALNTVWSALYGVLKSIVDGIGDFVSLIGDVVGQDWGFSMPDEVPRIPRLAEGGLVRAPTIAIVGDNKNASSDPEVISPLSKLGGMIGTGNEALLMQIITQQREIIDEVKRIRDMDVIGEMDGDVMFRGVLGRVDSYKRSHGGRNPF